MSEHQNPPKQRQTATEGTTGASRRKWLVAGAGLALPWHLSDALSQPASAAEEEAKAPPLPALGALWSLPRITMLDGSVYEPSSSQGKPLLVYWWSSTCPFCALQSPSIDKLWLNHRASGLQMVALSVDRRPAEASDYLRKKGYGFPAAWASPEWRKAFPKPRGLPITLLRGREGRLLLAEKGQMFAEDVDAIAQLL